MHSPIPPRMTTIRNQAGTVLAVALIFLLLLTLIGVTAMQGTTMQERMSGNVRDRNLGFQAAEAALRSAEEYLAGSAVVGPFNNTNGLYQPPGEGEDDRWDTIDWGSATATRSAGTSLSGLASQPRYIIEELAGGSSGGSQSLAADEAFTELPSQSMFFHATATVSLMLCFGAGA